MILIDTLQNISNWAVTVYPYIQDVLDILTWDFLSFILPGTGFYEPMFSLALDALLVFVSIGLLKKLFVFFG